MAVNILAPRLPYNDGKLGVLGAFQVTVWIGIIISIVALSLTLHFARRRRSMARRRSLGCFAIDLWRLFIQRHFQKDGTLQGKNFPLRLTLLSTLASLLIIMECFSGQLLSFLLREPSYTFKTFRDIDEHVGLDIYSWDRQYTKRWLKKLSQMTGEEHYARISQRMVEVPLEQLSSKVIEAGARRAVVIVNQRQLEYNLEMFDFLDLAAGEESHKRCQRIKPLPSPTGEKNPIISRAMMRIVEAGLVMAAERNWLFYSKTMKRKQREHLDGERRNAGKNFRKRGLKAQLGEPKPLPFNVLQTWLIIWMGIMIFVPLLMFVMRLMRGLINPMLIARRGRRVSVLVVRPGNCARNEVTSCPVPPAKKPGIESVTHSLAGETHHSDNRRCHSAAIKA